MRDDNYEPDHVLGIPRNTNPAARQGEEQQRAMGLPADWIGPADLTLKTLKHPVRAFQHWRLRRRLGPYAPADDR
jgi:hypothetical protein